jgi:hypothetical protein
MQMFVSAYENEMRVELGYNAMNATENFVAL